MSADDWERLRAELRSCTEREAGNFEEVKVLRAELERVRAHAIRMEVERGDVAEALQRMLDAERGRVTRLREALEKASRQTLAPTRAFGCVACRSFAVGQHQAECYVGAALADTDAGGES